MLQNIRVSTDDVDILVVGVHVPSILTAICPDTRVDADACTCYGDQVAMLDEFRKTIYGLLRGHRRRGGENWER